ncbi:hypothetical protein ACFLXT_04290 [Chloroflexota bacterium]
MIKQVEKRTQLLFRDDGKFQFRKLDIVDGFLVEKQGDDIIKGWLMFYSLQFPFSGYKGIHPDMVTLSSGRDVVLDPFNMLPESDKPNKGKGLIKIRISEIADTQRYKHQAKPKSSFLINRVTLFLGIALVMLALCVGIGFLSGVSS